VRSNEKTFTLSAPATIGLQTWGSDEGKPTASPSFLAGRPAIVRDYEKVGDFWLAKSSHAVSDSFFFGTTELSINYIDYHLLGEESRP
jgi:hypothetical protein